MSKVFTSNVYGAGFAADPTVGPGIAGPIGSLLPRLGTTQVWQKFGVLDTDWTLFGGARVYPPEQWGQQDVPASQTAVALEAMVSTNFATWKATRAGSIVALVTRLTAPCTAGTLTVQVTINGGASTIAVVTTNAANQSGGVSTQATGVDQFVAGDLIGMQVTTSVGWLPVTSDLEADLEIEETP